ncbi:MAG: DUF4405 domain-containing protein [Nitrospinota bacterium]|nr:MAG: DUF4405 domain-containing protein [Nitrospinota bacterium]
MRSMEETGRLARITHSPVWKSIFRHGYSGSELDRAQTVFTNFFLHIHPVKVRRETLEFRHTFYLGGLAFLLFLLLLVTGILLMFYYVPSVERAYQSMLGLQTAVVFGVFLRNLHRWSAHAMVVVVFLHMCRVFYGGAYKTPREFNWVVGVILLGLTLFLSFTGYLLPWDQLAYWAITVGTSIAGYIPVVGKSLRQLLLGGLEVGQETLLRFYVLHVAVLPLLSALFIAIHFWRIRKDGGLAEPLYGRRERKEENRPWQEVFPENPQKTYGLMALVKGVSPAVGKEPEETVFTVPYLLVLELVGTLVVLFLLTLVSIFFSAPLEELANPLHTPNPAKAPWYFLWLQELVSHSALYGGVVLPSLIFLGLLLLPYLDRKPEREMRARMLFVFPFTLIIIAIVVLTIIGAFFRGPEWRWVWPWSAGG